MTSDTSAPLMTVSVTGLGYVGLPVATALAAAGHRVIGFDSDAGRIAELRAGTDRTRSVAPEDMDIAGLTFTCDKAALSEATIHIIAVPTPVDAAKRPDLSALTEAATTIGAVLKSGDIVVLESTVFPTATEAMMAPILEAGSGLSLGTDFEIGYSPERINPGDAANRFQTITKIVSGSSPAATQTLAALYGSAIDAPIHIAPSIRVAEAAKVIENTQRDLNIALMNELAMLFHDLEIDTRDVLDAAATKWNFLPFAPGLVGGHCIGVDPYYLTHKAHEIGFTPQVVLAGRGTNESMPAFIATRVIQECVRLHLAHPLRIAILGLTYKADVPDTRNSKVIDLIAEIGRFGADIDVYDPIADTGQVMAEYGIALCDPMSPMAADAAILAVPHSRFLANDPWATVSGYLKSGRTLVADLSGTLDRSAIPSQITLWRL